MFDALIIDGALVRYRAVTFNALGDPTKPPPAGWVRVTRAELAAIPRPPKPVPAPPEPIPVPALELDSPDGQRWQIVITNAGAMSARKVTR